MGTQAQNLAILEEHHPQARGMLEIEQNGDDGFEVFAAKSGMPTAKVHGVCVHSTYDPVREAERTIATSVEAVVTTYVVYGFGLGYYIEALQRSVSDETDIYVIVARIDYFMRALATRSLAAILSRARTYYLFETQGAAIVRTIQHIDNNALRIVNIRSVTGVSREYFSAIDDELQALLVRKRGNRNTTAKFGLAWANNCLQNLPTILSASNCARLQRAAHSDLPVLLVSAGPSLETALRDISRWTQKVIIVAVDTACARLRSSGITPDVILVSDPQYWNSRHVDRIACEQSLLLFDPCVHPRVLRKKYRHLVTFSTPVPIVRLMSEYMPFQPSVGAGGTVTSVGWEFARWVGATRVYLVGTDFGYPHRAIHCRGCFFEERMAAMGNILRSYETLYHRYFCASPLQQTDSYRTQPLVSDQKLIIYANWFEEHIAQYPQLETIALNSEGKKIAAVHCRNMEDVVRELSDRPGQKKHFWEYVSRLPSLQEETGKEQIVQFFKRVRNIMKMATRIIHTAQDNRGLEMEITASGLSPTEKEVVRAMCARQFSQNADVARERNTIKRVAQKIIARNSRV